MQQKDDDLVVVQDLDGEEQKEEDEEAAVGKSDREEVHNDGFSVEDGGDADSEVIAAGGLAPPEDDGSLQSRPQINLLDPSSAAVVESDLVISSPYSNASESSSNGGRKASNGGAGSTGKRRSSIFEDIFSNELAFISRRASNSSANSITVTNPDAPLVTVTAYKEPVTRTQALKRQAAELSRAIILNPARNLLIRSGLDSKASVLYRRVRDACEERLDDLREYDFGGCFRDASRTVLGKAVGPVLKGVRGSTFLRSPFPASAAPSAIAAWASGRRSGLLSAASGKSSGRASRVGDAVGGAPADEVDERDGGGLDGGGEMGHVPSSSSPPGALAESLAEAEQTGCMVLSNSGVFEIPAAVFKLSDRLRILDLSGNRVSSLPPSVADFSRLRSLYLNQNRLQQLPEEIGQLTQLQFLSCSYNFLEQLPESVEQLQALRELRIGSNKIERFPTKLIYLKSLEVLDLSSNQIREVPHGVGGLQLVDLNLNENQISYLSEDLAKLPHLQILRLENNLLTLNGLPEQIFTESNISQILVGGNRFEEDALTTFDGFEVYMERNSNLRRASKLDSASASVSPPVTSSPERAESSG